MSEASLAMRRLAMQAAAGMTAAAWLAPLARARADAAVAVLYPDIGEPFRAVFGRIVEGIEQRAQGRVAAFAVGPATDAAHLAAELKRRDAGVIVALGRQGMAAAGALAHALAVVAGGVVSVPEDAAKALPVHTFAPDPVLLFAYVRRLLPALRRIHAVYDPRHNAWLVRRASDAARDAGIELAAHEAHDVAAALRLYQQLLAGAEPARDALWLPQDATTVEDNAVLPLVLRQAWSRNLAVVTSTVGHVKRGALLGLYPDNVAFGRTLGDAALRELAGVRQPRGPLPLRDVRVAVNTRTAAHLGIDLAGIAVDLVFPEP